MLIVVVETGDDMKREQDISENNWHCMCVSHKLFQLENTKNDES
jgi:hypothetical protein